MTALAAHRDAALFCRQAMPVLPVSVFSADTRLSQSLLYARYRNATICARVQGLFGLNVVSVVP